MISVRGTFDATKYYGSENDYCIYVYLAKDSKQIPEETQTFTAVGYGLPNNNNVEIELTGTWEDSKYGKQLKVSSFKELVPTSPDGLVGYLSSGLIKGIGKKTAIDIVSRFGTDTISVLEYDPEQLLVVPGITESKLKDIIVSFEASRKIQDLVSFLSEFGITYRKAIKIQNHFEGKSLEIIKKSPFRLCEISGFGFITVDNIARKLNNNLDDCLRIREAVRYVLAESSSSGDLYVEEIELAERVHELLNRDFESEVVERFHIVIEITDMVDKKILFDYKSNIYLYCNFAYESITSQNLVRLLNIKNTNFISNLGKIMSSSQNRLNIELGIEQMKAVEMCMNNNISIVTGGPGTGKTTTLRVILDVYKNIFGGRILQLAPTGRASRRMSESTGYEDAQTIHRALGLMGDEFDTEDVILDYDFVVVDEMSMVDMKVAYELFRSIKSGTKVLLLGDSDQLPSVGAGNVFRELINSSIIPVTKLEQIFRQGNESLIPVNAHKINTGNIKLEYGTDFQFINCDTPEETAEIIKNHFKGATDNIQILTPLRSKTKASSYELNRSIQEIVNPRGSSFEFKVGTVSFRVNDKVMQTKNKNDIFNGDVGIIKSISKDNVVIEFSGNRVVNYDFDDMSNVDLAYAMTIHKSQGSEYDTVIIPMLTCFYTMLRRNIIYTAITRAKTKVIFVGQKKALIMAIKKNDIDKRNTNLSLFIRSYFKKVTNAETIKFNDELEVLSVPKQIAL